jgi:CTP synthase (UTP-ammonia lyase)
MAKTVTIGIIGDYKPETASHLATVAAIGHAADTLAVKANIEWLPTTLMLTPEGQTKVEQNDGFLVPPGPFKSLEGVLNGIRLVREKDKPFVGT